MKNIFIFLMVLILCFSFVLAQEIDPENVEFPIAELGNCGSDEECEEYCDEIEHIEACIGYAEEHGLMSDEEIDEVRKVLPYLLAGTTPGGCISKDECDAYCDELENLQECVDFAVLIGDITEEEAEMAILTGGVGPGGCRRDECDAYCEQEENIMTCVEFAYEHGLINAEEYDMIKRTGGKGPGDCKGKEECEAFCEELENQITCMEFAMEYDLMDEDFDEGDFCMVNCLVDAGINPNECGEGEEEGSGCHACAEECFGPFESPEEDWEEGPRPSEGLPEEPPEEPPERERPGEEEPEPGEEPPEGEPEREEEEEPQQSPDPEEGEEVDEEEDPEEGGESEESGGEESSEESGGEELTGEVVGDYRSGFNLIDFIKMIFGVE